MFALIRVLIRGVVCGVFAVGGVVSWASAEVVPVDWRYTVQLHDNLVRIGQRFLQDPAQWSRVQKINHIADPYTLRPGSVLRIPVKWLRHRPGSAILDAVQGTVRWRTAGTAVWQRVSHGQIILSGTEIQTDAHSSVQLRFVDRSEVVLTAHSLLEVVKLSQWLEGAVQDVQIKLHQGRMYVKANPERRKYQQWQVLTPSAQAIVRGTQFRVAFADAVTHEETVGGLVEVSAGGHSVSVAADKGTVVRQGEFPTPPVELLAAADIRAWPSVLEPGMVRFPLPQQRGVVSWLAEVSPDMEFRRIVLSSTSLGGELKWLDLPPGQYVSRLFGVDAQGIQGLAAVHAFSVLAFPTWPRSLTPAAAALVRFAQPTFSWMRVAEDAAYRLQVARDPGFATVLYDVKVDQLQWTPPQALESGPYFWRIAAVVAGQLQAWSPVSTFVFTPGPGSVRFEGVVPQVQGRSIALDLPPPPLGLVYEAVLAPNELFTVEAARVRSGNGAIRITSPASGTWFLAVRLIDPADDTPGYSTVRKVEIH